MSQQRRRVPFPDRQPSRAFNDRFERVLEEAHRMSVDEMIPPENRHIFYHGRGWTQQRPDGTELTTQVEAHTAETTLKFDDLIGAKLSVLSEQVASVTEQMRGEFMRSVYARVSESVEQVGNVVDAKGKAPPEAFLEMLQKIEFGVNRKGEVTRPEMHMPPDVVPKFVKALEDAGEEFEAEVARLMAEKEAHALKRERERVARFKKRTNDS
jgi:hypothetical protein